MGVNTIVKSAILHNINEPVTILNIKDITGKEVDYNPGLCRDDKGNLWISIRSCVTNLERYKGWEHPNHYQNFLFIGLLDEKTLEVSELKEVVPEGSLEGLQWGIEDVRLFWRKDGLHGIGVTIPIEDGDYRIRQCEIIIDHKKGTYRVIKDYGRPFGLPEKNWSPPEVATDAFDFVYSPTQIVKDGQVIGEHNDLFIHNGTPLLKYEDGWISLGHVVTQVQQERTYAHVGMKWSAEGRLIAHSQLFHFNVGWREQLRETIEFASGLVWLDTKTLLVGLGVKDELAGLCKLPVSKLEWEPYEDVTWYAWQWATPPNRSELYS